MVFKPQRYKSKTDFFYFLEAQNPVPKDILSCFRLYLLRPSGLQEDIGSIRATKEVLYFSSLLNTICSHARF
jgi:hypothetical protein